MPRCESQMSAATVTQTCFSSRLAVDSANVASLTRHLPTTCGLAYTVLPDAQKSGKAQVRAGARACKMQRSQVTPAGRTYLRSTVSPTPLAPFGKYHSPSPFASFSWFCSPEQQSDQAQEVLSH